MGDHARLLAAKIEERSARVCIVGLGYVGLPLAVEVCKAGFCVDGYDVNERKVKTLLGGASDVDDVPSDVVSELVSSGKFCPTTDADVIASADVVVICVPTPLSRFKEPDMSYIEDAVGKIAERAHPGMLVVLESTTYPGTTRELVAPRLEERGFAVGEEVFVAFSPERVDPGNKRWHTGNTPKVVGGITQQCTNIAAAFYLSFLPKVVPVSSADTAEMVKLLENTFRSVNIALANEMAMICERLGLDVWEVISAASTKPFGFMPFYPGPGVGGHCIPIDPHYLAWKLRSLNFYAHFIELASEINYRMPNYVVEGVVKHLGRAGKSLSGATVLVLGVTYKKDVSDVRESPALDVMHLLLEWGATVIYSDPLVPSLSWNGETLQSAELTEELLRSVDIVVLLTDHSCFDYEWIAKHAPLIYDARNAFGDIPDEEGKIARLGAT